MYMSENKWPASADRTAINVQTFTVPVRNGSVKVPLRAEVAPRLTAMIQWWDQNVEPVYTMGSSAGTWGYAYRTIRGYATTLSNHASGTAIDINAPLHPLGKQNTVPADKVAAIRAKASELGLRWGGDYRGRKDEMHFEVNFLPTDTVATPPQTQSLTSAATDTAMLALEASKGTARAAVRDAKRKLQRNWWIAGLSLGGIAAVYLLFLRPRRKIAPAAPKLVANRRRRRR